MRNNDDSNTYTRLGQLIGASLGGLCVDLGGFYGLMVFSVTMGLVALGCVLYIRVKGHDLITGRPGIV